MIRWYNKIKRSIFWRSVQDVAFFFRVLIVHFVISDKGYKEKVFLGKTGVRLKYNRESVRPNGS